MFRVIAIAAISSAAVFAASVSVAQTTQAAAITTKCSAGLLSVYYARGEATPSEATISLIGRIGD